MKLPEVVSPAGWEAARQALLAKEKEATRARDALAAERRRLPGVRFEKRYAFEGPDGEVGLVDLFEGRSQLIVYHFMFQPGAPNWPDAGCDGCSMFVDSVCHTAHLAARDTTFALLSRAPLEKIEPFKRHMGWTLPWYSMPESTFNDDCGVESSFGLSVFIRDGDDVVRTYFTSGRGVDALGSTWTFLDLTPLGRQEEWEDSPEGRPQTEPYEWWRFHDDYEQAPR
jgi:predicted dithiol-disulfide oxidoreductase (DUF899 family)